MCLGMATVGAAPESASGRPAEAKPAPAAARIRPDGKGAAASRGAWTRSAPAQSRGLQGPPARTDPGVEAV